ncbi:MAG: trehalose-6-phosphate synthase [SAR202 cluster bacterium]|nr:trehalose-6-phosphate synthase [SAR202 cluster bacterium]HCP23504.1 trehalose-6-phosphate synthase [Dehalococcoidia bacterium]|tara:strand:- start:518 stop:2017 length:1500 start_codon:yes stop_codon:yes gene_type:complete
MAELAGLNELYSAVFAKRPLILASNRGPVEHQMSNDGRPEARRGSGSVVTAFSSLAQTHEFTWVASAMGEGDRVVSNNGQAPHLKSPLPGHKINLRYVVTPRRVYHKYYNILCNPLLWFLQHYMWNPPYNPNVDAAVHDAWEGGYIPVNQAFANSVIEEARSAEQAPIVIGHDYHLYLMPEFVRQEVPDAIIQHFIHIPWPTPQYWHMIPHYITRRICESLCATDLLGFQTLGDARSFLDTVDEFVPDVAIDRNGLTIQRNGHTTTVKAYPISINVEEVQRIANSPRALDYESRLEPDTGEVTIVRIDRAEPNKNIVRGFRAYELLLNRYPDLKGKVKFLAFLVPSRTHIRQYQRYMDEIQQVIQQINNNHGNDQWQPIVPYIENNYTQAIAGMKLYDALLVNTIIEGMNLVAKEGPVVNNKDGVLVLSQSSGVYPQLAHSALGVSPTDIEGTMEAMYQAITMSAEERKDRASRLLESVYKEDISNWLLLQMQDISQLL